MPKTNLCKDRQLERQRDAELVFLIRKYIFAKELPSVKAAAALCGVKPSTFYGRLKAPRDFTRGELNGIERGLDIPDAEMRPLR